MDVNVYRVTKTYFESIPYYEVRPKYPVIKNNVVFFLEIFTHLRLYISYHKSIITQVNRMSRSRRVLAIGGKQRILGLDMVCIETILLYLDSF